MAEKSDKKEQQVTDEQQANDTVSNPSAETKNTENMIPQSRFNEVNERARTYEDRAKALEAQLQQLKQQQQKQAEQTLAEQDRYQELYEQTKAQLEAMQQVREQAERYSASLQATNDMRASQIPPEKRHLIPEFDDPVALSGWLDRALPDLTAPATPKAPSADGGAGNPPIRRVPKLSDRHERLAEIAAESGFTVDKERIAEYAKQQAEENKK